MGVPQAALNEIARSYTRDRTEGQAWSVHLGVEKAGMIDQLREWFGSGLGIPVLPLGGYAGQEFVDDVIEHVEGAKRLAVLLYAGDFDASGEDIDRDFIERTDCWHKIVRVGLTRAQVERFGLTIGVGKVKDSRAPGFIERHGSNMQVELDALDRVTSGRSTPRRFPISGTRPHMRPCWPWRTASATSSSTSPSGGLSCERPPDRMARSTRRRRCRTPKAIVSVARRCRASGRCVVTAVDFTDPVALALWLAGRAMFVFPVDHPNLARCAGIRTKDHDPTTCADRGKHPVVKWSTAATTDDKQIVAWFSGPQRNIGVACKPSKLFVSDEDVPGGLARFAADQGHALPDSLAVRTGRGKHLYLSDLTGTLGNHAGPLKAYGVDVRGGGKDSGGYVVGPGSLHAKG